MTPPPQAGGGATNPPPPDMHSASTGFSQGNGSPPLLSPPSLGGDLGFKIATVARRQQTTPPHAAVWHPVAPLPTVTKNSFTALFPLDSPPAPVDNVIENPIPPVSLAAGLNEHAPLTASTPLAMTTSLVHPDSFLATFLQSWPETLITDDFSRWIYDTLCKGFIKVDKVYLALDDCQRTLCQDMDSSLRIHDTKFRQELDSSWKAALEHLNNNDRIYQSTVEQLSTNMATTARLTSDVLTHKTILDKITNQVQIQSGILNTITHNNNVHNAYMKDVEGCLADGDACLTGVRNTMEATTSSLRTDINNVHAHLIPDLHRDIKKKINKALAHFPSTNAVDTLPLEADNPTWLEGGKRSYW
jgi:hypothetical protein